jgi:multidrug efflux pump subunit AcrA (membrane-fusion protein)
MMKHFFLSTLRGALCLVALWSSPSFGDDADSLTADLDAEIKQTSEAHTASQIELKKADSQEKINNDKIAKIQAQINQQKRLRQTYEAEIKFAKQKQDKVQQSLLLAQQNLEAAKKEVAQAIYARNVALQLARKAQLEAQQDARQTAALKKQAADARQPLNVGRLPANTTPSQPVH